MRTQIAKRLLAALLSLALAGGLTPSAFAWEGDGSSDGGAVWEEVSGDSVTAPLEWDGAAPSTIGEEPAEYDTPGTASSGGAWADNTYPGRLYSGDVSFRTAGEPEAYAGSLAVNKDGSWGVPGDLTLRPEITVPAAGPSVADITAQIQWRIAGEDLSPSGLTGHALIQSLLMSTAEPLKDAGGNYVSILQQGAGQINAAAATGADSYIQMDPDATASWQDGKVKAELGDDPGKTGVYSFAFTIHDLSGTGRRYALDADVFTQATESNGRSVYLSGSTEPLHGAAVTFETSDLAYDFDGSGVVDLADGAALLDYVTGKRDALSHPENAAFGEDAVSSYSAHRFLRTLDSADEVTVPAGGSVTVRVAIALSEDEMSGILEDRPNGAYVEAFVHIRSLDPEGASHSIPVLGFYGGWTDASMFDRNSLSDYAYGAWTEYPYLYGYNGMDGAYSSYQTIRYADGTSGCLGVNPFPGLLEDGYLPARNALNNLNGSALDSWSFTQIRSSAAGRVRITDAKTDTLYYETLLGPSGAPYWDPSDGSWHDSCRSASLDWHGTNSRGVPLPEGTTVTVTLTLAPELYADASGQVDWDALGKGASLSTQLTIDNTAPKLVQAASSYDAEAGTLTVTARDNQFVSAVLLASADGQTWVDRATPSQTEPGADVSVTLDVGSGAAGRKFLVQLYDYACNVRTYEVTLGTPSVAVSRYNGYNADASEWGCYSASGVWTGTAEEPLSITSGTYGDGKMFVFDTEGVFWVIDAENPDRREPKGAVSFGSEIDYVIDMAYAPAEDAVYFSSFFCDPATLDLSFRLGRIHPSSGDILWLPEPAHSYFGLATDDSGTLYGLSCDNVFDGGDLHLYTIVPGVGEDGGMLLTETPAGGGDGHVSITPDWCPLTCYTSMIWVSEENVFLLAVNYCLDPDKPNRLCTIDPAAEFLRACDVCAGVDCLTALYPSSVELESRPVPPADEISSISLSGGSLMLLGSTQQLTASVLPEDFWDPSVIWESSDPSVVTVTEDGLQTAQAAAVGLGSAVITATSAADGSKAAAREITVIELDAELQALAKGPEGVRLISFNTWNLNAFTPLADYDVPLINFAETDSGKVYAIDMAEDPLFLMSSRLYSIGENNGVNYEGDLHNGLTNSSYWMFDIAYAPSLGKLVGVDGSTLHLIDENGTILAENDTYSNGGYSPSAIAYAGVRDGDDCFLIVDSYGNVFLDSVRYSGGALLCGYDPDPAQDRSVYLGCTGYTNPIWEYSSAVLANDSAGREYLFWQTSENLIAMTIDWDRLTIDSVYDLGVFPDGMRVSGLTAVHTPSRLSTRDPEPAAVLSGSVTDNAAGGSFAAVPIVLDAASTNGKVAVRYDTDTLELAGFTSGATLSSCNGSSGGEAVLAYAYKDAAAAGTVAAELFFTSKGLTCNTSVTLTVLEDGAEQPLKEISVPVVIGGAEDAVEPDYPSAPSTPSTPSTPSAPSTPVAPVAPGTPASGSGGAAVPSNDSHISDSSTPLDYLAIPSAPTIVLNVPTAPASEQIPGLLAPYADLSSSGWYREYAAYMISSGLMAGTGSGQFSPDASLTRGMLVMILHRAAGQPPVSVASAFSDVASGSWYAGAVAWAALNGLVNGYADGTFLPDAGITRQELAVILWRLARQMGLDTVSGSDAQLCFTDQDDIAPWALEAMLWACRCGILGGYGDGRLAPAAGTSRIEAAAMITRFLELAERSAAPAL